MLTLCNFYALLLTLRFEMKIPCDPKLLTRWDKFQYVPTTIAIIICGGVENAHSRATHLKEISYICVCWDGASY